MPRSGITATLTFNLITKILNITPLLQSKIMDLLIPFLILYLSLNLYLLLTT